MQIKLADVKKIGEGAWVPASKTCPFGSEFLEISTQFSVISESISRFSVLQTFVFSAKRSSLAVTLSKRKTKSSKEAAIFERELCKYALPSRRKQEN